MKTKNLYTTIHSINRTYPGIYIFSRNNRGVRYNAGLVAGVKFADTVARSEKIGCIEIDRYTHWQGQIAIPKTDLIRGLIFAARKANNVGNYTLETACRAKIQQIYAMN